MPTESPSRRVSPALLLCFAVAALAVASGILTGNGARLFVGLMLALAAGANHHRLSLRALLRRIDRVATTLIYVALGLLGLATLAAMLADFAGTVVLTLLAGAGLALATNFAGWRARLPLLNSPTQQTVLLTWAGLWLAGMMVLSAVRPAATETPRPVPGFQPSAVCRDGWVSYSEQRQGTCSWHGDATIWLR